MADATFKFKIFGREAAFTYPNTGNAGFHILNILSGKDYPLIQLSGYHPDNIFDIGANVGATALFFRKNYPRSNIYCYEPSPTNFAYLQKNMSYLTGVLTFNIGLKENDEAGRLYKGRSQCLQNSLIRSIEVTDEFEEIELCSARSELGDKLNGRCMMKIDTEGCELLILNDLADLLTGIDILYIEYHSERDRIAIDDLLNPNFYLWYSSASMVHRGNLGYISKCLAEKCPGMAGLEIKQ